MGYWVWDDRIQEVFGVGLTYIYHWVNQSRADKNHIQSKYIVG